MRKKALLALMMAAILLLSGCNLIKKDQAVDDATEILKLGDRVITKAEAKKTIQYFSDMEAYYQMMYYGSQVDTENATFKAAVQEEAIESLKQDLALTAKATELGLDQLTDEEKESVMADAQQSYDGAIDYAKSSMVGDTEGMDDEALLKAATDKLLEEGTTLESYVEARTKEVIDNKLREYVIKDVAVTDEEVQAEYDSKVASDKETYTEKAGSWATAANNGYSTLYYTPAGVRRVKQILVKFKEEDQTAINDAKTAQTEANTALSTAQAKVDSLQSTLDTEGISDETKAKTEESLAAAKQELDEADQALQATAKAVEDATNKAFANIDEDTDAILAQLAEGADWQALMDEKNEDPGMKNNEKGYAVAADMTSFDSAFVEAAMALAKPGDYSSKVRGESYGYYIIRYEGDEAEGPVALDDVKETISSSLLSSKQTSTYNDTVAKWVEEAGIKVNLNALKD